MEGSVQMQKMESANAMSVLKKLMTGAVVILFVGVCAYMSLLMLMMLV